MSGKRDGTVRKVTVSFPQHLLEYLDLRAKQLGISRSQLLSELVAARISRDRDQLAAEGYCFYAQEADEFACCCLAASSEVICRCS
jgi:metal-responsive CopG/Arc/MetJ family transcriptional regulator